VWSTCTMVTKNERIKVTLKDTKARRKHMLCRVYTVKLDRSHLNKDSLTRLKRLFLEAKWLYNYCVAHPYVFAIDDTITAVSVKVKDQFEMRQLRQLSSHMRQSIIISTQQNIHGLARLKAKGHKIGRLKFKSYVNSIPLKQYGNTYKIINRKYLHIQMIPQKLRVNGLEQLLPNCGKTNILLEVEHLVPTSRGGTDRVSNLTIACRKCNLKKGDQTAEEFGYPNIQHQAKQPLKAAACLNNIRWKLVEQLGAEHTYGYVTKYQRNKLGLEKSHVNDAFVIAGGTTPRTLQTV